MSRRLTWGDYRRQMEEGWGNLARCADRDDLDFHSEQPRAIQECKAMCLRCPVKVLCVAEALRLDDHYGIRGGLTADERHRLAHGQSIWAPGVQPPHASNDRYERGCRCNLCSDAHEEYEALRHGIAVIGVKLPQQRTAEDHSSETEGR